MDVLRRVHLLPVRHHSPRTSAVVRAVLEEVRPAVVLVEGPCDAGALIDVLVDPETRPPVAMLGYRTDGTPGSALWPFASYSPEYVAMAWARANGAAIQLIDVEMGRALAMDLRELGTEDIEADQLDDRSDPDPAPDLHLEIARARGMRSFEEVWEACFEAPAHASRSFRDALLAYAELVRHRGDRSAARQRDAFMAARIAETVAAGVAPERIAVVVGAAHAAAFVAGDVDAALEATLPAPLPCGMTLVPYSFTRLAEQTGYGAGNRAPRFYQRAHDAGCDFRRATLEVLVDFSEHLRLRGFAASLADTIEAYRLAVMLAQLRGKAGPGLDEVREATIATMCQGVATHVDGFLWPSVVGRAVGKVAARVGQSSLQDEFWREVRARGLPATDHAEEFVLKLNDPVQVGSSVFLHRLRVSGVPYASFQGAGATRARRHQAGDEAGGLAALARVREHWEAQWTPATDVALVEKVVHGDTLQQVATRLLSAQLAAATTTGAAADVLLEAVVAGCPQTTSEALRACDAFAASDDHLPSLARACAALSTLVSYGTSRGRSAGGDDAIGPLCEKTFDRAVLRVRAACTGDDDTIAEARPALRSLHEVAMAQPRVDKGAWLAAARALVDDHGVNPGASGTACALLYLAQAIGDDEVATIVGLRLSAGVEPAAAARFLAGFLEVNAAVLVKSRAVVAALDGFLAGIEPERFVDVLPVLRRGFGKLGKTERRYLLEHVVSVRDIGQQARAAQAVLAERDTEALKAMNADLAAAMDDLDELL